MWDTAAIMISSLERQAETCAVAVPPRRVCHLEDERLPCGMAMIVYHAGRPYYEFEKIMN